MDRKVRRNQNDIAPKNAAHTGVLYVCACLKRNKASRYVEYQTNETKAQEIYSK